MCAENAFGRSDPLNTDSSVLAKDPFGTPGKPGRPVITDHDNNFIAMQWTPPADSGGSPITHYDVQRKDQKTGRWVKVLIDLANRYFNIRMMGSRLLM